MSFPRLDNFLNMKANLHCTMEMKNAEVKRRQQRDVFLAFYQYFVVAIDQQKAMGAPQCVMPVVGFNFFPSDTQEMVHLAVSQLRETLSGLATVQVDQGASMRFPHEGIENDSSPVTMEMMTINVRFAL